MIYGIACNAQVDQFIRDREAFDSIPLETPTMFDYRLPRILDPRLNTQSTQVFYSEAALRERIKEQNEWDERSQPKPEVPR